MIKLVSELCLSSEVNLLVLSVIWFLLELVEERTNEMEGTSCIYKNPNQPIEARVKDLLSRMTLREKIGQMTQIDRSVARPSALRDLSIGISLSIHLYISLSLFLFL